jgi:hypothetical protein
LAFTDLLDEYPWNESFKTNDVIHVNNVLFGNLLEIPKARFNQFINRDRLDQLIT